MNDPESSIDVGALRRVPLDALKWRATTSGGPGGQHANRALTRVVVTFRPLECDALSEDEAIRIVDALGTTVRSSAGRFRSQRQNREAATNQLAARVALALAPRVARRATKPTQASRRRRLDDKKGRSRLKEQRRTPRDN